MHSDRMRVDAHGVAVAHSCTQQVSTPCACALGQQCPQRARSKPWARVSSTTCGQPQAITRRPAGRDELALDARELGAVSAKMGTPGRGAASLDGASAKRPQGAIDRGAEAIGVPPAKKPKAKRGKGAEVSDWGGGGYEAAGGQA